MFDFTTVKSKSEFRYWFSYIPKTGMYVATDNATHKTIAMVDGATSKVTAKDELIPAEFLAEVALDFDEFKIHRPEYQIGRRLNHELLYGDTSNEETLKLLKEEIDLYLVACCYSMYADDAAEKYAKRAISWLESTDFYTAPASTKYHESEFGGLIKHTLKVIDKVSELITIDTYKDVNLAESILAAICHDFCKINFYTPYQKNVKNEKTGVWEQELAFKYKGSDIPLGHGTTSMFIAMKLFKLTTEQAVAIRWHMNEYNVCDSERQDLMDANEKYRMTTLIQTADRLSII